MKIKPLLCATAMLLTCVSVPSVASAETTYADPDELITAAVEVALSGVVSTTYDEAIQSMKDRIDLSGNTVTYDGSTIGYWESTDSSTIYADNTKTDTVLVNKGTDIWEFEPTLLKTIIEDVNADLIETIVPNTADWSKIIGKYDVTLGDYTIPASAWHPTEIATDIETALTNKQYFDVYATYGKTMRSYNLPNNFAYITYLIDSEGVLYLQNQLTTIYWWSDFPLGKAAHLEAGSLSLGWAKKGETTGTPSSQYTKTCVYPKLTIVNHSDGTKRVYPVLSNAAVTEYYYGFISDTNEWSARDHFIKVNDYTTTYSGDFSNTTVGFAEVPVSLDSNPNFVGLSAARLQNMMSGTPQSSRQEVGSSILKKRLTKFASLVAGDTIEVTPTAWTVYGLSGDPVDFDSYLGDQSIMTPGDQADISAVADVEALAFKVVCPTSLPIYVNSEGITYVADSATIENQSNAAVVMTDITIEAKPDTGWTLLTSGKPSAKRDANEFTFTTDLTKDTVLARGEVLPFKYTAELSPVTDGVEALDLASVLVTVDWAEEA